MAAVVVAAVAAIVPAEAAVAVELVVVVEAVVAVAGLGLDPFCGCVCFEQTFKAPRSNKNDCSVKYNNLL